MCRAAVSALIGSKLSNSVGHGAKRNQVGRPIQRTARRVNVRRP